MQGRLSLRERLVILMVAAILPLFALSFWLALRTPLQAVFALWTRPAVASAPTRR